MKSCVHFLLVFGCLASCKSEKAKPTDAKKVSLTEQSILSSIDLDSLKQVQVQNTADSIRFSFSNSTRKKSTICFQNFTVLLYDFDPFESDYGDAKERKLEKIRFENKICKKDTALLYEDLDERFNNSLLQIIPKTKGDQFKITFCYLSRLYELFHFKEETDEQRNQMYEKMQQYKGQTPWVNIPDSAGLYFYLLPHTSDMVEITTKDGKIVPVKPSNSALQDDLEQKAIDKELARIKRKYQLKDTSVEIEGEYYQVADFTRKKKLFSYIYDAFFIRIDRYDAIGKKLETKFVQIDIQYGC